MQRKRKVHVSKKHETIETFQNSQTFETLVSDVSNARSKRYVNQNFHVYDLTRKTKTWNAKFVIVIVQLSKTAKWKPMDMSAIQKGKN